MKCMGATGSGGTWWCCLLSLTKLKKWPYRAAIRNIVELMNTICLQCWIMYDQNECVITLYSCAELCKSFRISNLGICDATSNAVTWTNLPQALSIISGTTSARFRSVDFVMPSLPEVLNSMSHGLCSLALTYNTEQTVVEVILFDSQAWVIKFGTALQHKQQVSTSSCLCCLYSFLGTIQ